MKTFAETKGEPPFDWNAFLAQDEFSNEELTDAMILAGEWVTCACGNLCLTLPRQHAGQPLDDDLADLGFEFDEAIRLMEAARSWDDLEATLKWRDKARGILALIEARSTELLKCLVP